MAILFNGCETFSHIEVENRHLCPLYSDCRPPTGGMTSNIKLIYTSLKITFSVADNTGLSSFI